MQMESKLTQIALSYKGLGRIFDYLAKEDNSRYISIRRAEYIPSNPQEAKFSVDISVQYSERSGSAIPKLKELIDIIEADKNIEATSEKREDVLNQPVKYLGLDRRAIDGFAKKGIKTIRDLTNLTREALRQIYGVGPARRLAIGTELAKYGLKLKKYENPVYYEALLSKSIDELNLTIRARRTCERLNAKTVGDLVNLTEEELLRIKNFGGISLRCLKEELAELGLSLKEEEK